MDDIDRAQQQEELHRAAAIACARNQPARDVESEVCNGCSYATRASWGKRCDGWRECLEDLQRLERGGQK